MNCRDSAGDSLLHYVASCMEEDAIFRVMSSGANIMCRWTGGQLDTCNTRNKTCVYSDGELEFEEQEGGDTFSSPQWPSVARSLMMFLKYFSG